MPWGVGTFGDTLSSSRNTQEQRLATRRKSSTGQTARPFPENGTQTTQASSNSAPAPQSESNDARVSYHEVRKYVDELKTAVSTATDGASSRDRRALEDAYKLQNLAYGDCLRGVRGWLRRKKGQDWRKSLNHEEMMALIRELPLKLAETDEAAAVGSGGPEAALMTLEGRREGSDADWYQVIRDWKASIDALVTAYRWSITEAYTMRESGDRMAGVHKIEQTSRQQVLSAMGTTLSMDSAKSLATFSNALSIASYAAPSLGITWAGIEAQARNYQILVKKKREVAELLRAAESIGRKVKHIVIAPRGDAILQFTNQAEPTARPILQYRVSSHMLAETSPLFQSLFSSDHTVASAAEAPKSAIGDDIMQPQTLSQPDGSTITLYHMPQAEIDAESSLTILLHAAHMHISQIPHEVSFPQFVAIAETALRYRCTAPLELVVEHRWLPQWEHKAIESVPDGLVLISYVFGHRWLFMRMTKSVILSVANEKELEKMPWPQAIKDKVWAVRQAKMQQLYSCVAGVVAEYLPKPPELEPSLVRDSDDGDRPDEWDENIPSISTSASIAEAERSGGILASAMGAITSVTSPTASSLNLTITPSSPSKRSSTLVESIDRQSPPLVPSNTPRCAKGSHWCDAVNLGWLLLMLNELRLLGTVISPDGTLAANDASWRQAPARSFAALADAIRSIPGPPHPVHPAPAHHASSICNPAPALRGAVNDVYNSLSGLMLSEVAEGRIGLARSGQEAKRSEKEVWRMSKRGISVQNQEVSRHMSVAEKALSNPMILGRICDKLSEGDQRSVATCSTAVRAAFRINSSHPSPGARQDRDADASDEEEEDFHDAADRLGRGSQHSTASSADSSIDTVMTPSAKSATLRSQQSAIEGNSSNGDSVLASPTRTSTTLSHLPPLDDFVDLGSEAPDESDGGHGRSEEVEMTVAEAQRILWPDGWDDDLAASSSRSTTVHSRPSRSGGIGIQHGDWPDHSEQPALTDGMMPEEKFLAGGVRFAENKMLVVEGHKQLRVEYERRVGLAGESSTR